jgi:hypothetical protein
VRRLIGRQHKDVRVLLADSVGMSDALGHATITASGWVWAPNASPAHQAELLRERTEILDARISALRVDHAKILDQLRTDVSLRLTEHRDALTSLRHAHDAAEQQATKIDANGLPLIGVGILLTAWPDGLLWTWLSWTLLGVAAVVVGSTVGQYVAHRRGEGD